MSWLETSEGKVLKPLKFYLGNSSILLCSLTRFWVLHHSPSPVPSIEIYIVWILSPCSRDMRIYLMLLFKWELTEVDMEEVTWAGGWEGEGGLSR